MDSSLFTKIFIFYSVISLTTLSNVDSATPYELVNKVCNELDNVDFCLEVLKSDNRSMFAKDVAALTKIAVGAATSNATNTRNHFRDVKTGPPGLLRSLKDCVDAYNNTILNLEICLSEEDCSLISYDIHVASDNVRRCQMIADSNGAHGSFITPSNKLTEDFCWLCESLANKICNK